MLPERSSAAVVSRVSMTPTGMNPDKIAAARERLARRTLATMSLTKPLGSVGKPPLPSSRIAADRKEDDATAINAGTSSGGASPIKERSVDNVDPDVIKQALPFARELDSSAPAVDAQAFLAPLDEKQTLIFIEKPKQLFNYSGFQWAPDLSAGRARLAFLEEPLLPSVHTSDAYERLQAAAASVMLQGTMMLQGSGNVPARTRAEWKQELEDGLSGEGRDKPHSTFIRKVAQMEAREWYHTQATKVRKQMKEGMRPSVPDNAVVVPMAAAAVEVSASDMQLAAINDGAVINSVPKDTDLVRSVSTNLLVKFAPASRSRRATRVRAVKAHSKLLHAGQSNIGLASRSGAVPASALPAARLRPWETDLDYGETKSRRLKGYRVKGVSEAEKSALLAAAQNRSDSATDAMTSLKLVQEDVTDPLLLRVTRPLSGSGADLSLATRDPSTLQMEVGSVIFFDHPLFSQEDRIATEIRSLHETYTRSMRSDTVAACDARLEALFSFDVVPAGTATSSLSTTSRARSSSRSRSNKTPRTSGPSVTLYDFEHDSVPELCARLSSALHTLSQRFDVVTKTAELMTRMSDRYADLLNVRGAAGFTSTTLRLDVQKLASSQPADAKDPLVPVLYPYLHAVAKLMEHLRNFAQDDTSYEGDSFIPQLLQAGQAALEKIMLSEGKYGKGYGSGGLGSGYLTTEPTADPYPGAAEHIFRIIEDTSITPDAACPVWERQRRAVVRETSILADVYVNDNHVSRVGPMPLNFPSFTVSLSTNLTLRLFRRPNSIAVKICDASSYFWRLLGPKPLSAVFVPVPGATVGSKHGNSADQLPTAALLPIAGQFEFSSTVPLVPHKTMQHFAAAQAGVAPSASPRLGIMVERLTHGCVAVSAKWIGNERTDGAQRTSEQPVGMLPAPEKYEGAGSALLSSTLSGVLQKQMVGAQTSTRHAPAASSHIRDSAISSMMRSSIGSPLRTQAGTRVDSARHQATPGYALHTTTGVMDRAANAFNTATHSNSKTLFSQTDLVTASALTSIGAPGASIDPNDPRAAALMKLFGNKGASGKQNPRFRVAVLNEANAFQQPGTQAMTLATLGPVKSYGTGLNVNAAQAITLEFVTGSALAGVPLTLTAAAAAAMAPPNAQRLRLLRLRAERPELFKNMPAGIPLRDEEIAAFTALKELLRSIPLPAAGADHAPAAMNATAWALATLIHSTQGVPTDQPGTSDAMSTAALIKMRMFNRIKAYLTRLQANPSGKTRSRRSITIASVVKEIIIPALRFFDWSYLMILLAPRRKLRPLGIDAGMAFGGFGGRLNLFPTQPSAQAEYKITVQLVRARNIPVRKASDTGRELQAGDTEETVLALAEVMFQGNLTRSAAVPGPNPQWNQVLSLPFTPPNQIVTPAALTQVTDVIVINLFDEHMNEVRVDDRDALTTVVQRQRRYLGTVEVPFFTLYSQGGIHGELRLTCPPVLLGYRPPGLPNLGPSSTSNLGGAVRVNVSPVAASSQMGNAPAVNSAVSSDINAVGMLAHARTNPKAPHIYLHMSVDPPLPLPLEEEDTDVAAVSASMQGSHLRQLAHSATKGESKKDLRKLLEHAAAWQERFSSLRDEDGKRRIIKPIVQTIDGDLALVTRYLVAQLPPPDPVAAYNAVKAKEISHSDVPSSPARSTLAFTPARTAMLSPAFTESGSAATGEKNEGVESEVVSSLVPRLTTADSLARFVSLIPTMPDSQAFSSADASLDIWATTQQTLEMGAGDAEEHAVMLHNFLLWLENGGTAGPASAVGPVFSPTVANGINPLAATVDLTSGAWKTYILLGRGQPDGETVFVMRQQRTTTSLLTVLIDASTGRAFLAEDDTCPLRAVGMVASPTNMWANLQNSCQPWRISFDLDDNRLWSPFFTPKFHHPGAEVLASLQSAPVYRVPDVKLAWALESEIHTALCTQLRAWRHRYVTRIRGDLTMQLKNLLFELEARAFGVDGPTTVLGADGPTGVAQATNMRTSSALPGSIGAVKDLANEHQAVLERLASRFRVQGFPLHATFSDMEGIIRLLQGTGVHRIEEESVQYGLAVAAIPYPNLVFSIWIYVVVLQPHVHVAQNA